MPAAWATAGMISASGGGPLFGVDDTGCVRLTEMVVVPELPSRGAIRDFDAPAVPKMTSTAPVLVPTGRPAGSAMTSRAMPPAGTVPEEGLTFSHGTFVVVVNDVPAAAESVPPSPM